MRGGAQAHLIEAADGRFYVVKFRNNPQHRRILVNEWICAAFLKYLAVATPEVAIVEVSPEFLRENPQVYIQLGSGRQASDTGWHFGSRFPGDPARSVVYDFLPDAILNQVENLDAFRAVLAFDKWVGNADSRQAVFFRARLKEHLPAAAANPLRVGFVAQMVDHGFAFDGPHWRFSDSPIQGLYFRPRVYESVRSLDAFQPWLDRILHFPEDVVDHAVKQIPPAWLEGEDSAFPDLLDRLLRRRSRVADLLEAARDGRANPFPQWKPARTALTR